MQPRRPASRFQEYHSCRRRPLSGALDLSDSHPDGDVLEVPCDPRCPKHLRKRVSWLNRLHVCKVKQDEWRGQGMGNRSGVSILGNLF